MRIKNLLVFESKLTLYSTMHNLHAKYLFKKMIVFYLSVGVRLLIQFFSSGHEYNAFTKTKFMRDFYIKYVTARARTGDLTRVKGT